MRNETGRPAPVRANSYVWDGLGLTSLCRLTTFGWFQPCPRLAWKLVYARGSFVLAHEWPARGCAKMNSASLPTWPDPPAELNIGARCGAPHMMCQGTWMAV